MSVACDCQNVSTYTVLRVLEDDRGRYAERRRCGACGNPYLERGIRPWSLLDGWGALKFFVAYRWGEDLWTVTEREAFFRRRRLAIGV